MIVALSVMGAVFAVGYGALVSIRSHRARVDAVASEAQHGAAVRRGLRDWLWGARLVADDGGPEFRGIDGVDGSDEDDDLSFLTNAPTPLGPSNTLVHLYVDRDPATPERGLVAELREWHGVRMRRVEVEPNATALEIRYLSGTRDGTAWLPSWISASILPRAVEIRISARQKDAVPALLRLPILVTFGGGG
ncbi:MAG TPA: hypothetical protein VFH27_03670 [Longimicrobiaceae bacterium]|nr:hypothetical protein [Longimicrobiaceae bacterium]